MIFDPLLYGFVLVGLFTPGPNVIMLTASGARFGLRRSLPHLWGVVLGVGVVAAVTALGVGAVVTAQPALNWALRVAAAGFILWMAWGYWVSAGRPRAAGDPADRPLSLAGAFAFQAINPKVWTIAFVASAGYGAGLPPLWEAARLGLAFSSVNLGVCLFWTAAAALLSALLTRPRVWRVFLRAMAVLLAASAVLVFR